MQIQISFRMCGCLLCVTTKQLALLELCEIHAPRIGITMDLTKDRMNLRKVAPSDQLLDYHNLREQKWLGPI